MPTILQEVTAVFGRLTAAGAATNARREVDRAVTAITELESQLEHVVDPHPRRAS